MWSCLVCLKSLDESDDFCYHCGNARGTTKESVGQQAVQNEEPPTVEFIPGTITSSEYDRDWFILFKMRYYKHAITLYLAPIIGLALMIGAWDGYHSLTYKISVSFCGLVLFFVSFRYLNKMTKIPKRK